MARAIGRGGKDYPDFGVSQGPHTSSYLGDMSELAVRLGSPNTFDRLGVQIFCETFENGLREWLMGSGGGISTYELRADYVDSGSYAVRLLSDNVGGGTANMQRRLPYPYLSTVGLEFHIKILSPGNRFYAAVNLYDGSTLYDVVIALDSTAKTLRINTESFGDITITLPGLYTGAVSPFHVIKARLDIENGIWYNITFDTDEYVLSQYDIAVTPSVTAEHMFLYFAATTAVADGQDIVLDTIILTLDEPS